MTADYGILNVIISGHGCIHKYERPLKPGRALITVTPVNFSLPFENIKGFSTVTKNVGSPKQSIRNIKTVLCSISD